MLVSQSALNVRNATNDLSNRSLFAISFFHSREKERVEFHAVCAQFHWEPAGRSKLKKQHGREKTLPRRINQTGATIREFHKSLGAGGASVTQKNGKMAQTMRPNASANFRTLSVNHPLSSVPVQLLL